jgi:hypothetical protein
VVTLNQTTRDWPIRVVTLSETKGLSERFFAALRMTHPRGRYVKCTNVLCFDLARHGVSFLRYLFDSWDVEFFLTPLTFQTGVAYTELIV